jgi:hypothetical protein
MWNPHVSWILLRISECVNARMRECGKHTAAHRDGSPYRLRIRHMARAKRVGRAVSVSRKGCFTLNLFT